jgi:hypothetical protein
MGKAMHLWAQLKPGPIKMIFDMAEVEEDVGRAASKRPKR